jgi:hypothetical protein
MYIHAESAPTLPSTVVNGAGRHSGKDVRFNVDIPLLRPQKNDFNQATYFFEVMTES